MSVSKDIPVSVTISGCRCKVWYRGQPITCFGCGKTGHVISACPNRARPHSYAAAVKSAQVSAQRSESPSSAAEDPSVDLSPSNNEAITNPASSSNIADKQHPSNVAPGRKSKAKKSKSGSSKAKDTTPLRHHRGIRPAHHRGLIAVFWRMQREGLSVMVPIYHDSSDSEPASAHTVDNVIIVTVDQSGSTPSTSEHMTTGHTVVESDGASTG